MKGAALVAQRIERAEKQPPSVATSALLGWLRGKIEDAEKALRCREDMANAKPLTAAEWEELAAMPGVLVTKGRLLSKAACKKLEDDQDENTQRQRRIAIKCRHEIAMFKATIDALTQLNCKRPGSLDASNGSGIWCAMCGKMGDHGSGACPQLNREH